MTDRVDILVFAPHPDDAEIGMGGCVLRWRAEGHRVGIVDMTRGEAGTKGDPETRRKESDDASRILDLNYRANLDLGDARLADTDDNRLAVIEVIRRTKPAALFATTLFDRHPDHIAAARLVESAQFLARLPKIVTVSPAHGVNRLFHYFIHDHRVPTFLVDVTDHHERKMDALRAYHSQFVEAKVPEGYRYAGMSDYLNQAEAYGRNWGAKIGVKYAEAFYTERPFAVADIGALLP